MPRLLVVADDLTGATDTGHAFAAPRYETYVAIRPGRPLLNSTIHSINTDSRYVDPPTAAERVREAIEGVDAQVYAKVDSTLRGNVVAETDAAMDATNAILGIVAPAAPSLGRVTAAGYHLVDGRLLTDTDYADDSNRPTTAHLPTLFADSTYPVIHLGIETIAAGSEAISRTFADILPDRTLVVCDATHQRHLDAIAHAGTALDEHVLYIGSTGLAESVTVPGDPADEPERAGKTIAHKNDGGVLGIVGSISETTLQQLAIVPDEWILSIDPGTLLDAPERAGMQMSEAAVERLSMGKSVVVTAAPDRSAVERTLSAGRKRNLTETAIRERVANGLAQSADKAIDSAGGLFVTGGDVAMAVFDALDATALTLSGDAVESGIPQSYIKGGPADGLTVVTKAGGFGSEPTVVNCLRYLCGAHG